MSTVALRLPIYSGKRVSAPGKYTHIHTHHIPICVYFARYTDDDYSEILVISYSYLFTPVYSYLYGLYGCVITTTH